MREAAKLLGCRRCPPVQVLKVSLNRKAEKYREIGRVIDPACVEKAGVRLQ